MLSTNTSHQKLTKAYKISQEYFLGQIHTIGYFTGVIIIYTLKMVWYYSIYIFVDLSKHYNSKVSLEHQLPTASQKLKTTDECVVSSLISLVTCVSKVSPPNIKCYFIFLFCLNFSCQNKVIKWWMAGGRYTSDCIPKLWLHFSQKPLIKASIYLIGIIS